MDSNIEQIHWNIHHAKPKKFKYRNGLKPSTYGLENYNSLKRYINLKSGSTSSSSRPLSACQNGQTILLPSSFKLGNNQSGIFPWIARSNWFLWGNFGFNWWKLSGQSSPNWFFWIRQDSEKCQKCQSLPNCVSFPYQKYTSGQTDLTNFYSIFQQYPRIVQFKSIMEINQVDRPKIELAF